MKHLLVRIIIAIVLICTLVPGVLAADHGFADITGHWAEEEMLWAADQGLFQGRSDTVFDPNGTMTRGMFVTVLGRFAQLDKEDYNDWYLPQLFTDLNCRAYYAPYINWATRTGLATGNGDGSFNPDAPITREQMAVLLYRFAKTFGYEFQPYREDVPDCFDDMDRVSRYAREAVELMRQCGMLSGRLNAAGGYDFDPQALAVRSECAAIFWRLAMVIVPDGTFEEVEPLYVDICDEDLEYASYLTGSSISMTSSIYPENVTNSTLVWVSSDPQVATVDQCGKVTFQGPGEVEIFCYTWNGAWDCTWFYVEDEIYIGYQGESYESKCMHVFGRVVDDPRHPYENDYEPEEYVANLTTVKVRCWDFVKGSTTEKYTRTFEIQVHKNLANTVKALFEELYACAEQYPVHSLGGYRWSNKSEHTPGLAIDINANENPYVDPQGNILVGKVFDPENNPYSFAIDGEVEQIFEKYGFRRGTWWSNGYKDYMHFSFFGT